MDAGPGHNLPPSDESVFIAELESRHGDLIGRRDQLVEASGRAPETIEDAETAGKAADFIKQIVAHEKASDRARKDEKEPYLERGRWTDNWFKNVSIAGLAGIKRTVTDRLTAYQRRAAEEERQRRLAEERRRQEEARRAAEEAERQRREAEEAARAAQTEADMEDAIRAEEAAAAAARQAEERKAEEERAARRASESAADLSRQHSAAGTVASLRTSWKCTAYDPATVDLEALRHHFGRPELEKAIRGFIKAGGRDLRGAAIEEVSEARVA